MAKPANKKLEKIANKELYRMIKDGAVIDVGGLEDDTTFLPEAHSSKWDGECWLKISHKDKDKIPKNKKAKEKIKDGKLEVEIDVDGTGRKHIMREGSLKWEVEYTSIDDLPSDDIERFDLDFPQASLSFYHQPELTQEEIDDGASRPENVINSYAGYFNKSNNAYETGKFCHIYRSKLIANDGAEMWVYQEIIGNELLVHLDRQWFIDHGFGVLDPNIGYTSIGGSTFSNGANSVRAFKASSTPASDGTLDSLSVYITGATTRPGKMGIYDGASGPTDLVFGGVETTIGEGATGWSTYAATGTTNIASGTQYWNALWHGTGAITMNYDSAPAGSYRLDAETYGSGTAWPDPYNQTGTLSFIYSMYFTYTESGGDTVLIIPGNTQDQALDSPDLVQANILVINDTDQGQTADSPDLVQQNTLVINDAAQPQTTDNITLSTASILAIADTVQAQGIDVVTLIQQHVLAPDSVDQEQTTDNITLDAGVILGIADMVQNQAVDSLSLTQAHNLAIEALSQGQTIDNVVFSQVEGKIIITLTIKSPGTATTIKSPGIETSIKTPGIDMGVS